MLDADEAYYKEKGEPLFSCVTFPHLGSSRLGRRTS